MLFVGDVHRDWDIVARGLAGLAMPPAHLVFLGDLECDRPLDALVAPMLGAGIGVHWIFGNHDFDSGPETWANLTDPARNPRTSGGALHGRVAEIAGMRVAGLGGTFSPRVWNPPHPPRLHRRAELATDLATLGPGWTADSAAALGRALAEAAIWPEDVEALAALRADVLVTHEAPSSHPSGVAALDGLARRMGARLVIHGHHHVHYVARASDGLTAIGVSTAGAADGEGRVHWHGGRERQRQAAPSGWVFGEMAR